MADRAIESEHFKHFRSLVHEFPDGEVNHQDSPDFRIATEGSVLGVEHTRVFATPSESDASIAARDSNAADIVERAQEAAELRATPPAFVRMFFNNRVPLKEAARKEIARLVASVVHDNLPAAEESITLEYGNGDQRHPAEVDEIFISRESQSQRQGHNWGRGDAIQPQGNTCEAFQLALNKKAKLYQAYLESCDRCWILLVADFMRPSQALSPGEESLVHAYTSPFERTYFLNCTENSVRRLNTQLPSSLNSPTHR